MSESDQVLQATCEKILMLVAETIDAEPPGGVVSLRMPGGPVIGRQITIDAAEREKGKDGKGGGMMNLCRISILNTDLSPEAEVARIEYEHDKQGKFGLQRVYSIQSIRRRAGQLVMLENFLAGAPEAIREQDFRPIHSETYAQEMVASVQEWTHFRAWQLQEMRKPR